MAGITEDDVFQACDALLIEGARPTIERVRQRVGRGSPNTVGPHLDAWFKHLGSRLKDARDMAVSNAVPDPVLQAARALWNVALAQTRLDFDRRLTEGMAAAVANVEAEKERAALASAAAFEASSKALHLQAQVGELHAAIEREAIARAEAESRAAIEMAQLRQQLVEAQHAAEHARGEALGARTLMQDCLERMGKPPAAAAPRPRKNTR